MRALERGEIGAGRCRAGAAPRCVPGLPGMRAGVPVGRGLWPRAGGGAGAALRRRGAPAARAHGAGSVPAPGALAAALHGGARVPGHRAAAGAGGRGDGSGSAWGCWRRRAVIAERQRADLDADGLVGCTVADDPSLRSVHDPSAHRRPLPRLRHGHAVPPRPRRHAAHARGQRLPSGRGATARPAAGRCTSTPATATPPVALAAPNVAALADTADYVVINSAGCGALLKDYGHLLGDEAAARSGGQGSRRERAACRGGARGRAPRWSWTWPTTRPVTCSTPSGCTMRRSPCSARSPASGSSCCPAPTTAAAARASTRSSSPAWPARCSTPRSRPSPPRDPRPADRGDRQSRLPDADRRRPLAAGLPIGVAHPVELLD